MNAKVQSTKKSIMLGLAVIGLAIGTSSFDKINQTQSPQWFFNGSDTQTDRTDPSKYDTALPPGQSCGALETICMIEVPEDIDNPGQPALHETVPGTSQTYAEQIEAARTSHLPNDTVKSFKQAN